MADLDFSKLPTTCGETAIMNEWRSGRNFISTRWEEAIKEVKARLDLN
jgi:hypothetical protein